MQIALERICKEIGLECSSDIAISKLATLKEADVSC